MVVSLCNWIWRLLIAAVLLLAAYGKWSEGISYLPPESVYDRLVAFSPFRHYGFLAVEVAIGLWVLCAVKPRWSAIAAGALFAFFTVLLGIEIFRASPVLCGCGLQQVYPDGDPRIDLGFGMARNLLLLIGCGWIWLMSGEEQAKTPAKVDGQNDNAHAAQKSSDA